MHPPSPEHIEPTTKADLRQVTDAPRTATDNRREPLLEVRDLRVYFNTPAGVLKAVDGVSFDIGRGETLGLVGESGCGKSVTAYSILRLVPIPPGEYAGGSILFKGTDLLGLGERQIGEVRGSRIAIVFQEPSQSLNPIMTIGDQISEVIIQHRAAS